MLEEKQKMISVIIPIYNVRDYLERCLNSVLENTYKNLEVICVNDCSPDDSLEILKKFAKKDERVKIVNKTSRGGGYHLQEMQVLTPLPVRIYHLLIPMIGFINNILKALYIS